MIIHDSRDLFYRIPFGAVENGTTVILRVKFIDETLPEICRCNIWRKSFEAEIYQHFWKVAKLYAMDFPDAAINHSEFH